MSRIGKKPVKLPEKVKTTIKDGLFHVEGPLGKLNVPLDPLLTVSVENGNIIVKRAEESRLSSCRQGLIRNLIRNAVEGVDTGFKKELDITGVGFRAEVK